MKHGYLIIEIMVLLFLAGLPFQYNSGSRYDIHRAEVAYEQNAQAWVDSVYASLNKDERLGQLYMIRAHSNLGEDHIQNVRRLIEEESVGGLCFFQGDPESQIRLVNDYQQLSKIPLLISMDAEWGTGMRLKEDGFSFPRQLALGAMSNDRLIYSMGRRIASHLRRIGVHLNFAPVVDINNNPRNPVIHDRSFGDSREEVARRGLLYMYGLQDEGVLACAKHFPGHGDTDVDSHYDLPVLTFGKERLDSLELFPFRTLIDRGVASVMVAHLNLPLLEDGDKLPSTLSRSIVTGLLREELGFDGLIITDAMEMKAVANYFEPGYADAAAVEAGNDIVLLPQDVRKGKEAIRDFIRQGRLDWEQIEQSVRRILRAKYDAGLNVKFEPLPVEGVLKAIQDPESQALKEEMIEQALTLVRNDNNAVPVEDINELRIASICNGPSLQTAFQRRLDSYANITHFAFDPNDWKRQAAALSEFDLVISANTETSKSAAANYGLSGAWLGLIQQLDGQTKHINVHFGTPYALEKLEGLQSILLAYEDGELFQDLAAQAIFGVFPINGKLPVTVNDRLRQGQGMSTASLFRLGYSTPERVGMRSDTLARIARLVEKLIAEEAAPGCQILLAKDGRIVYQRSFGYHTYDKEIAVEDHHLYDLASLTKVLATTLAVMDLFDQGKLSVFRPVGYYLDELKGSDKESLLLEDIMMHQARLYPWIPFYRFTLTDDKRDPKPDEKWYQRDSQNDFSIEVARNMFMKEEYVDSIWQRIVASELLDRMEYRYSDLGFYMLEKLVKRISGRSLDDYTREELYGPLGLERTLYNPYLKYPLNQIVPSEDDQYFRHQRIQGYVHDMGAAMMGGVSGHAGLFSTAHEVSILMQTMLNGGYYGGTRIFNPETLAFFTARPGKETRRGLGFDMKQLDPHLSINMSPKASFRTFGHLGFTGTCAWADPTYNLTFVFLSNRTWPSMENRKLIRGDYRPRLHTIAYNALITEE